MKSGPGQPVPIIQGRTAQLGDAIGVDQELEALLFDDTITSLSSIQGHLVLQTGAASFCNLHAQTLVRPRSFCFKQKSKVAHSVVGHVDHQSYENYRVTGSSQPSGLGHFGFRIAVADSGKGDNVTPIFFAIRGRNSNIKNDMSRVRLLPEVLASQVAAGEVIERPASVVKELVENSIDAEARKIEVFIRRGGISLIRVIDDGFGMERDDALLALERHATSKIRTAADLASIATLGFRGEAIPSIASVSRFRLTTREPNAVAGTEVIISGGRIETVRDGGEAPGTQVEVRSLFYNLPARRKFLRSENTESRHIEHQLHLQAIGHPGIAFAFVRDDRIAFQIPAAGTLAERIRDLHGHELVARLLPVQGDGDSRKIRIRGMIGQPGLSRQTRAQQFVFVNGRAIESPVLTAALREGYHTALMKGQFPVTFLFLELDPSAVDVNVHPAKREVRFRDPNGVREAVVRTIRETLESGRRQWQQQFQKPGGFPGIPLVPSNPTLSPQPDRREETRLESPELSSDSRAFPVTGTSLGSDDSLLGRSDRLAPTRPAVQPSPAQGDQGNKESSQFQIIGILNKLYVLMENQDGLVVVDQHAAHERILFEELRRRMEAKGVPSQRLLIPQTFELNPRDAEWVERNVATLQKMGIGIEAFGQNSFKIDSLPAFLEVADPASFLRRVIDGLKSVSTSSSPLRLGEEMIAKTVCRHAVKANDSLDLLEVEKLIADLLACDLPYCCPHGRPTMIQISVTELEKKFGRKV